MYILNENTKLTTFIYICIYICNANSLYIYIVIHRQIGFVLSELILYIYIYIYKLTH